MSQDGDQRAGASLWNVVTTALMVAAMVAGFCYLSGIPLAFTLVAGTSVAVYIAVLVAQGGQSGLDEVPAATLQRSPKRPLLERIREPDSDLPLYLTMLTHVVPFGIGFMAGGFFAIRIFAEALFGRASFLVSAFDAALGTLGTFLLPLIPLAYVTLWGVRAHVRKKLRPIQGPSALLHDIDRRADE